MNRRNLVTLAAGALGAGVARAAATDNGKGSLALFDVRTFGAAGNGTTLDSPAINAAINACTTAGGGLVYVPPGTYLSGTVVLKSNVTLYLEAGATILGSKDLGDYVMQSGPPVLGDANQKHLIFARDAENVGLAGPGRIDGQGPSFWVPSGRVVPPPEDSWRDVATYDWKPLDRASPMLEFVGCRHLRIEDVRIENASGWTMRPINCDRVTIRGIAIKNPVIGPNTDGIDLTGCRNVFISDCSIDTGDDAICLKSDNPYGPTPQISRNITITNCILTCCCNGLKFGTATRGGFENVTFSNSVIYNDDVDYRARVIAGIALEIVDGGWMEGITISNVRMQRVRTPIFIRRGNRTPRPDGTPGTLRGVMIENIHASGAILTNSITGLPGFNVEDVTLSNIRIDSEEAGSEDWVSRQIPEVANAYPEARMFGRLPAYGFYIRHVEGVRLRDVVLGSNSQEARPAIVCDDVRNFQADGLRTAKISSSQPVLKLIQTRGAWISNGVIPTGMKTYVALEGDETQSVVITGSDLRGTESPISLPSNLPKEAISLAGNVGLT